MGIRIKETTVKNNTVYCQGNLHHVTVTYCVFRDRATLLICSVLLKHRRICSFSSPRTQLCMKFLLWTTSMAADRLVKQICGTPTKPWNTEKRGEEKKKSPRRKRNCQLTSYSLVPQRHTSVVCISERISCAARPFFPHCEGRGTHAVSGRRK